MFSFSACFVLIHCQGLHVSCHSVVKVNLPARLLFSLLRNRMGAFYHATEIPCPIQARFHPERLMNKVRHGSLDVIMSVQ